MDYLGDFLNGSTVNLFFTTHNSAGAAVAPLSAYEAADVLVYKNSSNAQKTTTNGVTMTSPFDTIVGLHNVAFDTSNNTGDSNFWAIGNDYTVVLSADTETVDSQVVVRVLAQFSLENRCVNWAKVGSPSTSVNLSATTNNLTNTTTTLTNLPAITSNWLTAAGIAASALNGKGDWNIGKTGYALSAASVQAIWDALTSALTTVGSIGKLLVDNINATISSRLASVSYTAPDNTSITSIKATTDKFVFTVANQVDSNIQYVNDVQVNGVGTSGNPWGP